MGWRHLLFQNWPVDTQTSGGTLRYTAVSHDEWTLYPAGADVETNALLAANGFAEPDAEPVSYYSPGLDVTASRSRRADPQE